MAAHEYRYEHIEYQTSPHCHFELSKKDSSFITMHWHDALEIIRILDGELTVFIGAQEMHLHAGEIVLINPGVLHSTISRNGNTSFLLQIPSQDLYHYIPDMREKQFVWVPGDSDQEAHIRAVRDIIDELGATTTQHLPGYILHFESQLLELIYQLYAHFSQSNGRLDLQKETKNLDRISCVIEYTEAHYREPIMLNDVAEALHLQVNYFCRFFKEHTGQTYLNYLRDFRLSKIYQDLIATDDPIGLIATRHGFTNMKLFRQSFQERFANSPGTVRKMNRKTNMV